MTGFFKIAAKAFGVGLAMIGLAAVVLAGLIAWPVKRPPELASISAARKSVDFNTLPVIERFEARDGTELASRHYPAQAPSTDRIAIVIHGSAGSSRGVIHALSSALARQGVEVYAADVRGHGASGTRGDIAYAGQLQDDLADLVGYIRHDHSSAPLVLIGHSSGGGFVLRMAGSPIQNLFRRTVLLAPYLGYDAPTSRANSGGWASPDVPRFIGLSLLRGLGISWAESLPTLAFAVPAHSEQALTATYSYRLMRDFAVSRDFRDDLAAASHPITVYSGANDELMVSDNYRQAFGERATVKIVQGVNHMGIVSDPRAVTLIADDIATSDVGS